MFTVSFDLRGGAAPNTLQYTVEWFAAAALGGPERAEIRVQGPAETLWQMAAWLRCGVKIRNGNGSLVWHGFVNEVRIGQSGRTLGVSLAETYNRIRVRYTAVDADGVSAATETAWVEDADSIYLYGTREWQPSAGSDLMASEAELWRDQLLRVHAQPMPVLSDGGEEGGLLICVGWWSTLDWKYYENLSGRVEFDETGDVTHLVGWGLTSNQIGFWRTYIYHHGAQLQGLREGEKVVVAGSSSNNGTRTVSRAAVDEYAALTSTTIEFEATDDIRDAASGMGSLRSPGMIRITGSALNSGYRLLEQASATYLNVEGAFGAIVDEAAGPSVTLAQGHHIETVETNTTEAPGATVTLSHYDRIGQAWQSAASWPLGKVALRVRREGTPSQPLTVEIQGNAAGAPNGTVLASATVAAVDVPTTMNWIWVQFARTWSPAAATLYWIVVRTAGSSVTDYYAVELNSETLAPDGQAVLWTGAAWTYVTPAAASMPFRVWGEVDAAVVLRDVLGAAPIWTVVDMPATLGWWINPYATGDLTALSLAEKLLGVGTSGGERLAATVAPDLALTVVARGEPGLADWHWAEDGALRMPGGLSVEEGMLPAGRLLWVDGVPEAWALQRLRTAFVERAQFDALTARHALTFAGSVDPLRRRGMELG